MVDLLSRDDQMVTVRFNNHTGRIPADSLAPISASPQAGTKLRSVGKANSQSVSLAKESGENIGQSNTNRENMILAAN